MKVIVRTFNPESDSGLIFDSFPKGVWHAAYIPIRTSKTKWMQSFYARLKTLLSTADVLIACTEEDANTIIGYSIIQSKILHFVYVKEGYRNKGIGTLLTRDKFDDVNHETLTKVGFSILSKLIGESNGEASESSSDESSDRKVD